MFLWSRFTDAEPKEVRKWQLLLPLLIVLSVIGLDGSLQLRPINRAGGNIEVRYLDAINTHTQPVLRSSLEEIMNTLATTARAVQ